MASKLQSITGLLQSTALDVTNGYESWGSFLKTAAWNYKYPFQDQLLIYAQRPDATACASFDVWNKKLKHSINKGAKGIALVNDTKSSLSLHYVYDVSDTTPRTNTPVPIWKAVDNAQLNITEGLFDFFDFPVLDAEFSVSLRIIAETASLRILDGYIDDLNTVKQDSLLEDLDDFNVTKMFRDTLINSVAYEVLERCGIPGDLYYEAEDFAYIKNFNTIDTISILGTAVNDVSETVLREIESIVKDFFREERAKQKESENNERDHIQTIRGLSYSELSTGGNSTGDNNREVRNDAEDIPERPQERIVHEPDTQERASDPLSPHRQDSEGESGIDSKPDVEIESSPGEGRESDIVGSTHGNVEDESRRNSTERADLHLNLDWGYWLTPISDLYNANPGHVLFIQSAEGDLTVFGEQGKEVAELLSKEIPTFSSDELTDAIDALIKNGYAVDVSEAINFNQPAKKHIKLSRSYLPVLPQNDIDAILRTDRFMHHKKADIVEFFLEHESAEDRAKYMSECYDSTYCMIDSINTLGYVKTTENKLHVWSGNFLTRDKESYLSFDEVQERVAELIELHEFLETPEHANFPSVEEQERIIADAVAEEISETDMPVISQEDIDHVLCRGSGFSQGKYRIYELLESNSSKVDAVEFLKHEYGTGGSSVVFPDGSHGWQNHSGKGLQIEKGKAKLDLNWTKVYTRLAELYSLDRYLNKKEIDNYPAYIAEEAAHKERIAFGKELRDFYDKFTEHRIEDHSRAAAGEIFYTLLWTISDYEHQNKEEAKVKLIDNLTSVLGLPDITPIEKAEAERLFDRLSSELNPEALKEIEEQVKVETKTVPSYDIGDIFYLGSADYTIFDKGEIVTISDNAFPLITKDLEKADFERMLLENPLNEHLTEKIVIEPVKNEPISAAEANLVEIPVEELEQAEKPVIKQPEEAQVLYRYYSTQRPVDLGTYPNPGDNKPVNIVNFDSRQSVENDSFMAWGYLEYEKPLTDQQISDFELRAIENETEITKFEEEILYLLDDSMYVHIQYVDDKTFDYTLYKKADGKEIDGGQFDDFVLDLNEIPGIDTFEVALNEILAIHDLGFNHFEKAPISKLDELLESNAIIPEQDVKEAPSSETEPTEQNALFLIDDKTYVHLTFKDIHEFTDYNFTLYNKTDGVKITEGQLSHFSFTPDQIMKISGGQNGFEFILDAVMSTLDMPAYEIFEELDPNSFEFTEVEGKIINAVAEEVQDIVEPEPERVFPNTIAHQNYKFLQSFVPQIMNKEYSYMRFESEGFESLSVEYIGNNTISVMHTYIQNGDLMRDPDVTLLIDHETQTVNARSYEQSSMGMYEEVEDYQTHTINKSLESQLNSFFKEWSKNILAQNFTLKRAIDERTGEDVELIFNQEIKPEKEAFVEPEKANIPFTEQLSRVKEAFPEALAAITMGEFYEFYDKDAEIIGEMFGIELTSREFPDGTRHKMYGFPFSSEDHYFIPLREAGYQISYIDPIDSSLMALGSLGVSVPPLTEEKPEITEPEPVQTSTKPDKKGNINFRITDSDLGVGTPKVQYANNVAAIRLLKKLEAEDRKATPIEQGVLSKYVGWGGLSMAFDPKNGSWSNEYAELKELLTDDEYSAARESTLTAYYTSPTIINAIYNKLSDLGFTTGNILEPSCGVGNFFGMLPESMSDSKLYGVELDKISGRIAQQLYQQSNIAVQGYEATPLPDSFFDVAIGNVPFGQFKVLDKKYDKYNFMIHDYFFAKTLDKVRPGGIIAFVTSTGTMDKANPAIRKYIAQRAELLGAVRLPNNAFLANAGTKASSDILFLKKRDRIIDIEPDWVHTDVLTNPETGEVRLDRDGKPFSVSSYFTENPEMVLGELVIDRMQYGREDITCKPIEGADLGKQLEKALSRIDGQIEEYELDEDVFEKEVESIPADPNVRNFSYTIVDGEIYFRENSRMNHIEVSDTRYERIKGLIELRDCVHKLIDLQTEDYSDELIKAQQKRLNELYDTYTAKYGLINSRGNSMAFSDDSAYYLLCSLENIDDEGNFKSKSAMFTKRTIGYKAVATSADTPVEALTLSMAEKARVDLEYMKELTGMSFEEITEDLKGVIFPNPVKYDANGVVLYETADEYLSGNVREKLRIAREYAELNPEKYGPNVEALEKAQPIDLEASDISVRLGATWIEPEYINQFIYELLEPNDRLKSIIKTDYSNISGSWNISSKNNDYGNIKVYNTYGTNRANAYKIIEDTLNLKDVRVYDYEYDDAGKRRQVLNKKETTIAQLKQESIKEAFAEWIWKDPERRNYLVKKYNEMFNNIRPREYNGDHITFNNMNPAITLHKHQKDAVAHILYGGNTLLGHVVGAGKTFEMTAAAMESKRLGLCNKSLIVVPNHLIEQWASDVMKLYPSANLLVATKKDFETNNRKKFCGRIATGDYDIVIIGHSQFEKIPMSVEHQREMLEEQLDTVLRGIEELKENKGEQFSIKQMEKTRKTLENRLERLNDDSRKDDIVTFEQLGVDRLFIDEAHFYKNLFLYTKMRNVGGIAQTEAKKSSDLYMKTRFLSEMTDNRGVVFATGTPISNSMTELYTMQRYLQYDRLRELNLTHFDEWASTFGETVTAIELAPEGTGYRAKTRFSKFYNLPELMSLFKEVADIKTADMLDLDVPEANYHNIAVKPSEFQKDIVASLSERADKVRNRLVDPSEDNMLKITNDGRKVALDQRLFNPMLPDDENSKTSVCADNVFDIWEKNSDKKSAQLVFCDLSTPHNDGQFNVYDDLKQKLIKKGIPEREIAFIHDANTDKKKDTLFANVRAGKVRVLLGSTFKMGAGTNVQDRLIALHDLDCPWRPSDLEQRSGRIIRQGNTNDEVDIYRYVTEATFDAYLYQLVENKQRFISQIMTSKSPVRSAEDIDEASLSYAEIKALAAGNPLIKEKMDLDIAVSRLKTLKASYLNEKYRLEDRILKYYPTEIKKTNTYIANIKEDIETVKNSTIHVEDGISPMVILGKPYTVRKEAGEALFNACSTVKGKGPVEIGSYRGLKMEVQFDSFDNSFSVLLQGKNTYSVDLKQSATGNISRIDSKIDLFMLNSTLQSRENHLVDLIKQQADAEIEITKPFSLEDELKEKTARLAELNILLDNDSEKVLGKDGEMTASETEQGEVKRPSLIDQIAGAKEQQSYQTKPVIESPDRSYDYR